MGFTRDISCTDVLTDAVVAWDPMDPYPWSSIRETSGKVPRLMNSGVIEERDIGAVFYRNAVAYFHFIAIDKTFRC